MMKFVVADSSYERALVPYDPFSLQQFLTNKPNNNNNTRESEDDHPTEEKKTILVDEVTVAHGSEQQDTVVVVSDTDDDDNNDDDNDNNNNDDDGDVHDILPPPHLSPEVVYIIMSYCDAATVSRAACVSREWHQLSRCNRLWEQLCRHVFGLSATQLEPRPDPVKALYILSYQQFRNICHQRVVNANPFGNELTMPTIPVSMLR